MIHLPNQAKVYITAQAATIKLPAQDRFLRSVARILEHCPQVPISMNDVIRACEMSFQVIDTRDVIISRSTNTDGEYDNYRYRRAR